MAIFYKDNGFYFDDFGGFVPEGAVEITEKEHLALLEGQAKGMLIIEQNGKPVLVEQAVEISLDSAKQSLIGKISAKTDRLKAELTGNYPQTEIDSFYRQEQEARAFLAGENNTPEMLSSIAKIRNLPLALLAQAVVRKADELAGVIGAILGQKQKLEARAEKADSLETLAEIEMEVEQWSI